MAACNQCGQEIAWKSVHRPSGDTRSGWEKMVPALDADGKPLKKRKKNGKGRTTLRSVPSEVKHTCGPKPTPSDPIPSDERVPLPEWHGDAPMCGATGGSGSNVWVCTRTRGHDGLHVAHTSPYVELDRWEPKPIPPREEYPPHDDAPVPEDESQEDDISKWCGVPMPTPAHPVDVCSRLKGHTGDHVAHCDKKERGRLPQDAKPVPVPSQAPVPQTPLPWDEVDTRVRVTMKAILDEYGIEPPPQRIEVRTGGKTYQTDKGEIVHPRVADVISYVARRRHCYLHGPAGGGKTYGAEQACRLVGLECAVVTMPGMTYSKILGFKTAEGVDTVTTLLDCFEHGKVAILDEFDRTLPAVAAALNSMLENGKYAVGDRVIVKHGDFAVIATGNTDLRGGTRVYTSAQPIDYATAARFAFISWPYDQAHEEQMVRGELPVKPAKALVAWARAVRADLMREHLDTVLCGPREAKHMAEDVSFGIPFAQAAESWVWRGLDAEIVARLVRAHPYPVIAKEAE